MELSTRAIIDAYRQTELHPVAHTWDTRARLDGRVVACGCALVALCRAAGIDPEPIIAGAGEDAPKAAIAHRLAALLGLPGAAAEGIVDGWDHWPATRHPSALRPPAYRAAYVAAWDAGEAVLGPVYAATLPE